MPSSLSRLWPFAIAGTLITLLWGADTGKSPSKSSTAVSAKDTSPQRAMLDQYCVGCHNQKLSTAGIALDTMRLDNVSQNGAAWEKVLRKVATGEMPPPKMPRPSELQAKAFTTALQSELDRNAAEHPNPGRPTIHRLNRAEYSNAVRDLLGLDIDAGASLPADDSGYGFDNIADVLSTSPVLLERYVSVARKVSRLAVGDPSIKPGIDQFSLERNAVQNEQISEDLPFGSRGGMAIRYRFPLDAEYSFKITMRGGGAAQEPLTIRMPVKAGTRTVGVTFLQESEKPELVAPVRAKNPLVGVAAFTPGQGGGGQNRALPAQLDFRLDNARVKLFTVPANGQLDSVLIGGPYDETGPGTTATRRKIFVCEPASAGEETSCARTIMGNLARHAYRRPVTDADLRPLLAFYQTARRTGSFDSGIELALRALLVSPDFLYRVERDPAGTAPEAVHRISDFELASRLSFFIWSSIPDDQLLDLAQQGKLSDPAVLKQQTLRMLADPKSKALTTNFAGQWLYLRNLAQVKPDPDAFPEFDESLRNSFLQQTQLFFDSILRENRSVMDLLDADYTFLNERLARHYGIPNIHGSHLRRVALDEKDPMQDNRRGLLGQGSILMVTSYPNRTSPVLRGKWILENLLGTPPPPPPANIPDLKAHSASGALLSLRQQMEQHRANPTCSSCHARMDPLGFSLENMDGVGKWRTKEANMDIDTSGVLPNGTKFNGPAGLRGVLLSRRDEFAGTMAEKLFTYALGRGLEYYDKPTIRQITRLAATDDYRISSFILGITQSTPFQMRRSQDQ